MGRMSITSLLTIEAACAELRPISLNQSSEYRQQRLATLLSPLCVETAIVEYILLDSGLWR